MRLFLGLFLALSGYVAAEPTEVTCAPKAPSAKGGYPFSRQTAASYEIPDQSLITDIIVTNLPVFDETNPDENNIIYRFANRFHILTRPDKISSQLLFKVDDLYDEQKTDESARILRSQKYLYDADIRPVSLCNNNVTMEVITRDVWSFTPEASFSRSGGENEFRLGVREINLFGTGVELAARHKKDIDRDSTEFVYKDKNIKNTRVSGKLVYSDNDDGSEFFGGLELPFYSLDSLRSWQVSLGKDDRIDTQYFRGDDITEVQRESEDYLVRYGWSDGLVNGKTKRWSVGYRFQKEAFTATVELPPPANFPTDKKLSYPFLDFSQIEAVYTTDTNKNQIHRTEDIHLGHELWTRVGYAAEAFGSDTDRLLLQGEFSDTLAYDRKKWLQHELSWYGLYNLEEGQSEDVTIDYQIRYLREQTKHRAFFASLQATYTHNLNANTQLFYGGDTGARAFDNRFQVGDRRMALTLEERMYTDIHLFNLIRVGWAMFIDIGRAWNPDGDDGIEDDYLASAGLGLRLASSKSDKGSLLHIDLAFPLTNKDDPDVDSAEVSVKMKTRF